MAAAEASSEISQGRSAAPPGADSGLGGNYTIATGEPDANYAGPGVTACRAIDKRFTGDSLVALICAPEVAPRLDAMTALRGLSKPGMLGLRDFGPIDWADGKQRMAAIYAGPRGGRLSLTMPFTAMQVIEGLLRPALEALREIHGRAVTHRAIRPNNLYLREGGGTALSLGPSVAVPPGYDQPDIYEPLETAAADLTGRGDATPRHDVFALGMTALALLMGRQPGSEFDRDDLMLRRLEFGSLGAVADRSAVPPEVFDALYGLTSDDAGERWTLNDLGVWLKGGRPGMPRVHNPPSSGVPLTFAGKQIRNARALAYMIGRVPAEGARQLRGGEMRKWLHEKSPDRTAAMMIDQVLAEGAPDGGAVDDMLLAARAVIALDPNGPVRYAGLAVDPHGLGPFLVDAASSPEKRQTAINLILHGLPQRILDRRPAAHRANPRRATRQAINFERLRRWLESTNPWDGYERCLYELNEGLPCRSGTLGGKWISTARELALSLDQAVASGKRAEPTIDRSIAAFLAARIDADGETLRALMSPKDANEDAMHDAMRLFAELQSSLGGQPLHGLAQWCGRLADRLAQSIHHRQTRAALLDKIGAAIPAGSISGLLNMVDLSALRERDAQGFGAARKIWDELEHRVWAIERDVELRRLRAWQRGRDNVPMAAGGGAALAFILTLFLQSGK